MTTLEILQKELPVYIWVRMIKYPFGYDVDPTHYDVPDLFDLFEWRKAIEPVRFWAELRWAYLDASPGKPTTEELEHIFRKHRVSLSTLPEP